MDHETRRRRLPVLPLFPIPFLHLCTRDCNRYLLLEFEPPLNQIEELYPAPHIWYQRPATNPFAAPALANFVETRRLRQARLQIEAMEPTMKEYMERITSSMDEFCLELRNNTAAIHANTSRLDDLLTWRPDLERRVADLQQGRAPAATALGAAAAGLSNLVPPLAKAGNLPNATDPARELPHGSNDHSDTFLQRGQPPVTTPVPLPGTGQYNSPVAVSPFVRAS